MVGDYRYAHPRIGIGDWPEPANAGRPQPPIVEVRPRNIQPAAPAPAIGNLQPFRPPPAPARDLRRVGRLPAPQKIVCTPVAWESKLLNVSLPPLGFKEKQKNASAKGGMGNIHLLSSPDGMLFVGKELKSRVDKKFLDAEYTALQKIYAAAGHVPENIVRVYGIAKIKSSGQDKRMLIMERIDGPDGSSMFTGNYLDRQPARSKLNFLKYTIFNLLRAVDFARKGRVAHNDIKPLNFMFDRNGTLKLIDWGVSCESGKPAPKGTKGFVAREALEKHKETVDVERVVKVPTTVRETVNKRIRGQMRTVIETRTVMKRMVTTGTERRSVAASADEKSDIYSVGVVLDCCVKLLGVTSDSAKSLLKRMTDKDRGTRIDLDDALNHRFFHGVDEASARALVQNMPSNAR